MLSIHRIEDIHMSNHGHTIDGAHWFEFEILTQEGIQEITLYVNERTNAYKKIQYMLSLMAVDDGENEP